MAKPFLFRLWSASMKAYQAFRAEYLGTDQLNMDNFADFDARRLRYSILWAMYENTAYDAIHSWAQLYKSTYGLYQYVRNIYNPTYRIGEFWKSHLWGGSLDALAGDGKETRSALPILTDNEKLRPAIAQVWQWSNWQIRKDIFSLWGTVLGDCLIKIVDDVERKKVYLDIVHPSQIAELITDAFGNVKGYVIEAEREDPRNGNGEAVTYREMAWRDGDSVNYQTYLNDGLYAWDGQSSEWQVGYGFVPMVVVKHNDVGLDFGWSEIHAGLSKFREVDDQASKLNDQIRKTVEGGWLFAGMSEPKSSPNPKRSSGAQSARQEVPVLYTSNSDAKAISLVNSLDIAAVSENIKSLTAEIERDYPELNDDMHNMQGDISGRALRLNRAPVENKVQQRRPNYDNALVRAQQMAVAIGGMRGYFDGFDLTSFAAGALDHSIGDRPVFAKDPMDDIEMDTAFWAAANSAKAAGVPLAVYLKLSGWAEDKIELITKSNEYQLRQETSRLAVAGAQAAVGKDTMQKETK